MSNDKMLREQEEILRLLREGRTQREIASILGLHKDQVYRRVRAAKKADSLDPELLKRLRSRGMTDLGNLHSGWLIERNEDGTGQSLYFRFGPENDRIELGEAIREVLTEIPRAPEIPAVPLDPAGKGFANFVMLADLHVGGDYGSPELEADFHVSMGDLIARLPPAEKAFLIELGDLLESNDHKGVTPQSGNPLDVHRGDHLRNTQTALRLMRDAIVGLARRHVEVEVHLIKGNHDPTAYIAVLLALAEHFADNPRVQVVITDEEFRVIPWGTSAVFPHHGDRANWNQLKDVWADLFPDEWAAAKMFRMVATAHFHHDRKRDLVGCVAEQFRTLHRPNAWAKSQGLLSRGSLSAITLHKERGELYRTISSVKPVYVPGDRSLEPGALATLSKEILG